MANHSHVIGMRFDVTFNQVVVGSSPTGLTILIIKDKIYFLTLVL